MRIRIESILSIAAVAMIAMTVGIWVATPPTAPAPLVPACSSDDGHSEVGYPCLWDARTDGNRKGASFMALGPDGPYIAL